jgi:hypothetical protein
VTAVTETEWLAWGDPEDMLEHARMSSRLRPLVGPRKLRLFACACVRLVWDQLPGDRFGAAILLAERHADGLASAEELRAAVRAAHPYRSRPRDLAQRAAYYAAHPEGTDLHTVKDITRCIMWAKIHADLGRRDLTTQEVAATGPTRERERLAQAHLVRDLLGNPFQPVTADPAWLSWNDGTIVTLARAAYDERLLPQGHLDPARLAVLADALEDAGCSAEAILGHLRNSGPHVRGCWVIDRLLGKE